MAAYSVTTMNASLGSPDWSSTLAAGSRVSIMRGSTIRSPQVVSFDLSLRRSISFHSISKLEEIKSIYAYAITELATKLKYDIAAWRPLLMRDLDVKHLNRVYIICPEKKWEPALGEIELVSESDGDNQKFRRVILFKTAWDGSGYILLDVSST